MNEEPLRVEGRGPSWRGLSQGSGTFELGARPVSVTVSDSAPARQSVFELAGLLTQRLERTRPLIRVRFAPDAGRRLARPGDKNEWRSARR